MDFIQAGILGIIEGITEFLPVSSTGHLILASQLLGIGQSDFQKSFEIIIQLGAILAVAALYWRKFLDLEVIKRIIIAFIPTGIIGLALYKIVKTYLIGSDAVVLWALALGGLALIAFELLHKPASTRDDSTRGGEKEEVLSEVRSIPYQTAGLIGLFQALAIIPGVSRSAATIVGGLLLNMRRTAIVEFSFLLAVPTMLAATGLDLVKNASSFSMSDAGMLAVGFIAAFIVALFSIKWLLSYIRGHSFIAFGIYRIAVAILFFIFIIR